MSRCNLTVIYKLVSYYIHYYYYYYNSYICIYIYIYIYKLLHHHHQEGAACRSFGFNSSTFAVSKVTSRRWWRIESLFQELEYGIPRSHSPVSSRRPPETLGEVSARTKQASCRFSRKTVLSLIYIYIYIYIYR